MLVTEAFDYKANPKIIIEFMWQFIRVKPSDQGFDSTANSMHTEKEHNLFLRAITSHVQLQLRFNVGTLKEELDRVVRRGLN